MNWNLRLAYLNTFFFGISMGIFQTAFAIFITQGLFLSNAVLGGLFTVSGVASTIFILPSGYLADKYRRDRVIRISVIFGVVASLLMIISTMYVNFPQTAMNFLMISQIFGGIAWGFNGPAMMALIADSIKIGDRSKYFASLRFYEEVALTFGPFIAIIMTIIFGDTWDIVLLQIIITFAATCEIISFILASLMSDKRGISLGSIENPQDTA
ncbi:MAG: MFS transporter, partial [Candidatus Heimdallarchaeota archaeon]